MDKSNVRAKGQGERLKVKVTEVKAIFAPIWSFQDNNSSFEFTDGYKMMHIAWIK